MITIKSVDWMCESPIGTFEVESHKVTAPNKSKGRKNNGESEEDVVTTTRIVQYEGRSNGGYLLRMMGSQIEVNVATSTEDALMKYMLPPDVKDVSKFLLCPMPGTLISLGTF